MTGRRNEPEPLRERIARRAFGLVIVFGVAALFVLLIDATEKLWRWLGWG